jgi:cation diffusion facilitator family transporter
MATSSSSDRVIYAALLGNALVATTKFGAAFWTGSSAMLSEAVHSCVDTSNELLLIYGRHRAKRPADRTHPFGHGRELYFWNFIVALMVFALGAGVALYEGITHVLHPVPIESPIVNYVVIGLSFLFEFSSWRIAWQEFRVAKGNRSVQETIGASKDPTTFTVLFEDSAALVGLLIALAGIASARVFHRPELDGAASIGIALVLAVAGVALARRTKELLVGESAHPDLERAILDYAGRQRGIASANGVITRQIGPDQVLAALSVEFEDGLTAPQIEQCVISLEKEVKATHPEVAVLFVKPQTSATWRSRIEPIQAAGDD